MAKYPYENGAGSSDDVKIDSSYKLGIGITSPSQTLDVTDAIAITSASTAGLYLNSGGGGISRIRYNGGAFQLRLRDEHASADRIAIDSGGSVGIGVTSPGEKLEVNGSIKIPVGTGSGTPPTSRIYTTRKVFNVLDYGAVADGASGSPTSTNRIAFTNALIDASAAGGIVYVPEGQYKIDTHLTIPQGVTLKGSWESPHHSILAEGTTLLAYEYQGYPAQTPFITMSLNSALEGVTIYYPEQNDVSTIRSYPWTIKYDAYGEGYPSIINVTLANSYQGIYLFYNSHYLRDVNMCALSVGIDIDQCCDCGRLENVHIHNKFWAMAAGLTDLQKATLQTYTLAHLTGFLFGYTNWEYVESCFVIWAKYGMKFVYGTGYSPNVFLVNSGVDQSDYALWVEQINPLHGCHFANSQILGKCYIGADNTGPIKFVNCIFGSDGAVTPSLDNLIYNAGSGTIQLANCIFLDWGLTTSTEAAVKLYSGTALLTNCEFASNPNKVQVRAMNGASAKLIACNFRSTNCCVQDAGGLINYLGCSNGVLTANDVSGSVGIGTASPNFKFSVGNKVSIDDGTNPTAQSGQVVLFFDGTNLIARRSGKGDTNLTQW
jgi:hypothetical protein